ncbi:pathogenicity island protein [Staphylococcus epidermidis]|uniref:pathogenicity island protein n=1 Tax=Staphylococcus epidermidis TaxID=1282 RepID=UPI0013752068|nr:pathogenicity island protein [Staphylococcus epidermidis]MCG2136627.1 pathogenicity island protein [Staphylococcus epidermidis]
MTIIIENKLTNDHIKVLNVLRNTKHDIITKQNIFNQLNMEFNRNNDRWLRNTINSLVVDYGYPIGYSYKKDARGYFMVKSEEQKELALRSIKRHIEGSLKRYEELNKIEI